MSETEAVSWDAIALSKQFEDLTDQQKIWCVAWLSNSHDCVAATKLAYNTTSNARVLSYEVRKNPSVVAFLELYKVLSDGAPSKAEQIAGIVSSMRAAPAYEQSRMRNLLAKLTGVLEQPEAAPDDSPQQFAIGDFIEQDGNTYRVTAVEVQR